VTRITLPTMSLDEFLRSGDAAEMRFALALQGFKNDRLRTCAPRHSPVYFHSLCIVHPQVPLKVLNVVGGRLRKLVGIIEELSFTTVRSRLISVLLRLAQSGEKTREGIEIQRPPSNQKLA